LTNKKTYTKARLKEATMTNLPIKILITLVLFLLIACSEKDKGKVVLFEMKNFDKELQECVHNNLNDKWTNCKEGYLILHSSSEKADRKFNDGKITFIDITDAEPNDVKYGTEKLILNIQKSDIESDSIVINVQQFLLESNGQWRRVLNMGDFTFTKENPICEIILDLAFVAQCK
jgi:hypothetical protein